MTVGLRQDYTMKYFCLQGRRERDCAILIICDQFCGAKGARDKRPRGFSPRKVERVSQQRGRPRPMHFRASEACVLNGPLTSTKRAGDSLKDRRPGSSGRCGSFDVATLATSLRFGLSCSSTQVRVRLPARDCEANRSRRIAGR